MRKIKTTLALAALLLGGGGCAFRDASTKGWVIPAMCPHDGYPYMIVDDELLAATAQHPNGGTDTFLQCMNPEFVHSVDVTNWFNVPVKAITPWVGK